MNALLVVTLILALVVIVWLVARSASYRARYRYTEADLDDARKDSVTRSRSAVSGKVQEQLAPLFPEFLSQFNPRDARFIGTPLDFVVFDGLDDDDGDVRRVVFVEVKTGKSALTKRERRVRDAVTARRVEYQLLRLPSEVGKIAPACDGLPALGRP
ncbi:MAG: Holliday junction resolvase-like protein [Solirubrobacteraceae bacterium]|jgi:predicted Holliday junction resolvase-like endonuclease